MRVSALLLFFLFILLSAFFSSSETAYIAANPFTLDYLEKKGSKRAKHVRKVLAKIEDFLTTILIGNTLVNVSAASVATYIFVSLIPDKEQAVFLATIATTLFILFFSEINPKIYAAHNPLKISFLFVHPIRFLVVLFYPLVKAFTFLSGLLFRSSQNQLAGISKALTKEETKILISSGIKGLSTLRKKMLTEILDIASRPIKEIMTPRPQIKAIELSASNKQILDIVLKDGFSRYPVYKGRLDQIEGLIHAKDLIPYLIDNKEFNLSQFLRSPFFVPESSSLENVLVQMQENAVHLAFVVDEFGNMEGIVTLEDIIEEIVGDIRDEYDDKEEWFSEVEHGVFIIKGSTSIKDINYRLLLKLPEKSGYTTLAGFLLYEFGKIPHEKDVLNYRGHKFIVEKMSKKHISLIRVHVKS